MNNRITKTMRAKAGFTLVELIVVIAILGILAGVGTVGYSGYIKKANEAADNMLLSAVNQAFAAACLENGTDVQEIDRADMSLTGTTGAKKVDSVSLYDDAFQKYYAGNENSTFKVINSLVFDAAKHLFVNPAAAGDITLGFGGGVVKVNSEDVEKLKESTFVTAEDLGVEGLLEKVNDVTTFAALAIDSTMMQQVFASSEFRAYAAQAMNMTLTGDPDRDTAAFNAKLVEIAGTDPNEQNKVLANAAVMFAAKNATELNQSDIVNLLSNSGAKNVIINDLATDTGKALSEAALAYGMYTAYAYSTNDPDLIAKTDDPIAILNGLDDGDFQDYMKKSQGTTDLNGYLAALNMVNSSADDVNAVTKVLQNGFNDSDLIALLNQAIGK